MAGSYAFSVISKFLKMPLQDHLKEIFFGNNPYQALVHKPTIPMPKFIIKRHFFFVNTGVIDFSNVNFDGKPVWFIHFKQGMLDVVKILLRFQVFNVFGYVFEHVPDSVFFIPEFNAINSDIAHTIDAHPFIFYRIKYVFGDYSVASQQNMEMRCAVFLQFIDPEIMKFTVLLFKARMSL